MTVIDRWFCSSPEQIFTVISPYEAAQIISIGSLTAEVSFVEVVKDTMILKDNDEMFQPLSEVCFYAGTPGLTLTFVVLLWFKAPAPVMETRNSFSFSLMEIYAIFTTSDSNQEEAAGRKLDLFLVGPGLKAELCIQFSL